MIRVQQVKIPVDGAEQTGRQKELLHKKLLGILGIHATDLLTWKIKRRSVDARKKPDLFYIYTLDAQVRNEDKVLKRLKKNSRVSRIGDEVYQFPESGEEELEVAPIVIGMGPAGLLCGYLLAKHGYSPLILERGKAVEERTRDVEAFWKEGKLLADSNVSFGEGGAGTFSDGKLNTLVKDKEGRSSEVLELFHRFGAAEEILYDAKPHVGTDVLSQVVKGIREEIIRLGGQVRFETCVRDLKIRDGRLEGLVLDGGEEIPARAVVLATGHSARDTFQMLYERGIPMEAKAFAVGMRVEHPQEMINESQYGRRDAGALGAAPYKLTARTSEERGVYSFCMCPGGYVVNASTEEGRLAVNGMSYSGRDSGAANSAVIVSVTPKDFPGQGPLSGIAFQRELEERAFRMGNGKIPIQRFGEFKAYVEGASEGKSDSVASVGTEEAGRENTEGSSGGRPQKAPHCKGDYAYGRVDGILPAECNRAFVEGMEQFGRQIQGFDGPDVWLMGVESRTSSPVRIPRNEGMESDLEGLYPCGEGAGYAGGITSAAMDGMKVAEAIARKYRKPNFESEQTGKF